MKITLRFQLTPVRLGYICNLTSVGVNLENLVPYSLLVGVWDSKHAIDVSMESALITEN